MGVCACGASCLPGEGWCYKCFRFWQGWWLRYVKDVCPCEDCEYRRKTQPVVDELETRNAARP